MKYSAAMLAAFVLVTSGCAVTARTPTRSVVNPSDSRHSEEFDMSSERLFEKREKAEKIDRLLQRIRGNGS